jgi:hypothetical protein
MLGRRALCEADTPPCRQEALHEDAKESCSEQRLPWPSSPASTLVDEVGKSVFGKMKQFDWGKLQGLWEQSPCVSCSQGINHGDVTAHLRPETRTVSSSLGSRKHSSSRLASVSGFRGPSIRVRPPWSCEGLASGFISFGMTGGSIPGQKSQRQLPGLCFSSFPAPAIPPVV